MDPTLIFLDLDGTLLTSAKTLAEEDREALLWAAGRGAVVVPTTGRFYLGMPESIRALPFVRYTVDVNGAEVYDAREDRVLRREEIPAARAVEVFDTLDRYDGIYDCFAEGWGYMDERMAARIEDVVTDPHYIKMLHELRKPVSDFKGYVPAHFAAVQKAQIFFKDMAERARALRELPELLPDISVTTSVPNNIELNAARANKGEALRFLAGYLGVSMARTVAIGDGLNDISMLRAAGTGVAMENGCPEAKDAADFVTADNDHGGVAKAIRRIMG